MSDIRAVKTAIIRWKPHMWWVYYNDDPTSNVHSDTPQSLKRMVSHVWPEAKVSIDWDSYKRIPPDPSPPKGQHQ